MQTFVELGFVCFCSAVPFPTSRDTITFFEWSEELSAKRSFHKRKRWFRLLTNAWNRHSLVRPSMVLFDSSKQNSVHTLKLSACTQQRGQSDCGWIVCVYRYGTGYQDARTVSSSCSNSACRDFRGSLRIPHRINESVQPVFDFFWREINVLVPKCGTQKKWQMPTKSYFPDSFHCSFTEGTNLALQHCMRRGPAVFSLCARNVFVDLAGVEPDGVASFLQKKL